MPELVGKSAFSWMDTWKVLAICCFASFVYVMWIFTWRRRYSRLVPGITPGFFSMFGNLKFILLRSNSRSGYPINAYILQLFLGFGQLFQDKCLFVLWASIKPLVFLTKFEAIEAILKERALQEIRKPAPYYWTSPILGDGLLLSSGEKWRFRRRCLNSCFRIDILKEFIPAFDKHSRDLLKIIRLGAVDGPMDITDDIFLSTFHIIFETMFGVDITSENSIVEHPPMGDAKEALTLMVERVGNPLHWLDFTYKFTKKGKRVFQIFANNKNYLTNIIREGKKRFLEEESISSLKKHHSLIDLLIQMHLNGEMTEDDVRDEAFNFALAGHDTTASAIVFTLYMIGLYPDVQLRLQNELNSIFGDDAEQPVCAEHLSSMEYLECVIKETQRIYPAVPVFARQITKDLSIGGYPVRKGSFCVVLTYQVHRDEKVFPDPEKFDPDRFLPENCRYRNPFAYIPFSAGFRNCIGQKFAMMEIKVIIANVLRNFTLESLVPRDRMLPQFDIVLKPSVPVNIRFIPRCMSEHVN